MNGKPVSTEEFKKFLNLEGIDLDESVLELTLDAAISYCNKRNETEYTKDDCPKEVRLAILGLATHYFENRTGDASQSQAVVLKGVDRLLDIARLKISL